MGRGLPRNTWRNGISRRLWHCQRDSKKPQDHAGNGNPPPDVGAKREVPIMEAKLLFVAISLHFDVGWWGTSCF